MSVFEGMKICKQVVYIETAACKTTFAMMIYIFITQSYIFS